MQAAHYSAPDPQRYAAKLDAMENQTCLIIRSADPSDLDAITDIYNEAIRTTTATFDTEPKSNDEQLHWFKSHGTRHPIIVAELDGIVVGWACLTAWSDRAAYSDTAAARFNVPWLSLVLERDARLVQRTLREFESAGFVPGLH